MPSLLGPLVFQKPAGAEDRERYRAPCQKQWPNSLRREPKQKVNISKFCALQDFSPKRIYRAAYKPHLGLVSKREGKKRRLRRPRTPNGEGQQTVQGTAENRMAR